MVYKERQSFAKPVGWLPIILAVATAVPVTAVSLYTLSLFLHSTSISQPLATPHNLPVITGVAALGRLEPKGEVIHLSAPDSLAGGVRVTKLLIKKGDRVRRGQIVALLDSYDSDLAAVKKAQMEVQVTQANLDNIKAGAKISDIYAQKAAVAQLKAELSGQIFAQKATIARIQAQLNNAEIQNRRYQLLYDNGAISASDADNRRLQVDTFQQELNEAQASLARTIATLKKQLTEAKDKVVSIAQVRPTDIQVAEANIESAKASVVQAKANLELNIIRSPIDGQVLKIHAWPGEIISTKGIADLGYTNQMCVVAEIYETDIEKVHVGQSAIITSSAFTGKLRGTVTDIGLQVGKQSIFTDNPGADTDNKVIDVKVLIDNPADSRRVAGLTNLQVQVVIQV